ncbi:MAG: GGDEF domain-containing protein [Burkholderiales bacterium]|jgi:diguanylate cyclase (GGDEF)-like protein|nr:GGDEF domain-containing protein [Burkholderiales bacterium]
MITAAQTQTLLAAIILVAALATLVWLALALIARIAPRASLAMACANAAAALSLTLHALRGVLPDAVSYWPGDVLAVASFALLGAAAPAITTRQLVWKPGAAVVVVAALALLALPYDGDLRWQARLVNGAGAGLTLAAGIAAWRSLGGPANGRRTPAPLALPLFLIALLMAARSLETVVHPGTMPDMRLPTEFNLVFLWTALVLTLLQNATLAFLVLMRLILRIERLLERDPLTDTLNRRAFDQSLEQAHAWLKRGRGYALVMIDMDRFKQLNDSLGHAAGDAALRQMVRELQPCLREVDRFGRLGGEEFCVLLPDTDLAGAALVAERMRALVDAAPLRWLEQDWPLSASFGIAEGEREDESGDMVLARADAALYRAKNQGRNVVQA